MNASAAHLVVLGVALVCLAIAAAIDISTRIIPNRLVFCVAAAGFVLRILEGGAAALWSVAIAGAVLVPLAMLVRGNAIGGGDAKMIGATLLLVDPGRTLALLTAITLAGGVLAISYMLLDVLTRPRAVGPCSPTVPPATAEAEASGRAETGMPYGLAILAGTVLTIWWQP